MLAVFAQQSCSFRSSITTNVGSNGGNLETIQNRSHSKSICVKQCNLIRAVLEKGVYASTHTLTPILNGSSFFLAHTHTYSIIDWFFILPCSPNFCGLWEAAMELMKHCLRRFMGDSILIYEEMTTFVCQIEQILNNRPLMALTNNPYDIIAPTPSMLVTGS